MMLPSVMPEPTNACTSLGSSWKNAGLPFTAGVPTGIIATPG